MLGRQGIQGRQGIRVSWMWRGGAGAPRVPWRASLEAGDAGQSKQTRHSMYVYYYRTYENAVSGGGREGKRRTCAKGPYQPRPVRSSLATSQGEGEVVSKKVGKEVRGAQG